MPWTSGWLRLDLLSHLKISCVFYTTACCSEGVEEVGRYIFLRKALFENSRVPFSMLLWVACKNLKEPEGRQALHQQGSVRVAAG